MNLRLWISRYRGPWLLLLLLAIPIVVWGAKQAWDSNTNRVEDWLPPAFEETKQLIWFFERFGTDELLMVSWEGCTLEDPRLERLRDKLGVPARINGQSTVLFDQVLTGPQLIAELTEGDLNLTPLQAMRRLQGWLIGPDADTTGVVAVVSPAGAEDRHAVVDYVYRVAEEATGLPAESIHVAGPTVEGVAIDRASTQTLLELNLFSFAICLLVCLICLRSGRVAIILFVVAIFNQQLSMALIHYSGSHMDSVLLLTRNSRRRATRREVGSNRGHDLGRAMSVLGKQGI